MANALDLDVSYFFQEMSADVEKQTPAMLMSVKKLPTMDQDKDPMARRETLELVRAYYRIPDPAVRKRLAELTKAVAKRDSEEFDRTMNLRERRSEGCRRVLKSRTRSRRLLQLIEQRIPRVAA